MRLVAAILLLLTPTSAWMTTATAARRTATASSTSSLQAVSSRQDFLRNSVTATISTAGLAFGLLGGAQQQLAWAGETVDLPNGVSYEVLKKGSGPKPEKGELVAIRFSAYAGDNKIDDIFDTPEPYYTRLGSGGLLKGVEETLPLMVVGDRWRLSIPVSM